MMRHIRDVEDSMGDGRRDDTTPREREQIAALEGRAVARDTIAAGAPVTADRVLFRRAPAGLPAHEFERLEAPIAASTIPAGTPITADKLLGSGA
jgi:sialic acid synthase SpsE